MATATPRKRRRWIAAVIVLLVLLGAALWVRSLLQPERLSAFLLQRGSEATGLLLALEQPASVGFWPDLHLELDGLSAHVPGESTPLLQVQRVETALPWSAIRSGELQLQGLRLIRPELDLAALGRWLASRDTDGPPAPLRVPQFDAPFSVSDGVLRGDGWSITSLALELRALRLDTEASLSLSGVIQRAEAQTPFHLRMNALPRQEGSGIRLDPLRLALHAHEADAAWLVLTGAAGLDPPQSVALDLTGELPQWPTTWPALPLATSADETTVRVTLDYEGAMPPAGTFSFVLERGAESIRGTLRAGDVGAWLAQTPLQGLPPLHGNIEAARLHFDGIEFTGVRLQLDDDASEAADTGDAGR